MIKFNPFTGTFDFVGSGGAENFSYKRVIVGKTVEIPPNQEMILTQEFILDGTLILNGELTVIEET